MHRKSHHANQCSVQLRNPRKHSFIALSLGWLTVRIYAVVFTALKILAIYYTLAQ